ncbi:hypothetical protein NARC_10161 [Candidatus Nitrosocosmicus arcticus]|uniref:Uncharacterized protein n=1 Tax=Candidatus Nitrosocosmicus arcticus TaxID=2035267 RepID=A0A557SYS1_9ARCH|nr:hypothetical protein NARC_10161 [Candidatus Nitrosocosmicus arcticus]
MECTLITFINNSSNIFRIIVLYLFQVSIRIKLKQVKDFYNNLNIFTEKWDTRFKIDMQFFVTTHRNRLSRGLE